MESHQCDLIWYQKLLCACALWRDDEAQIALIRLFDDSRNDDSRNDDSRNDDSRNMASGHRNLIGARFHPDAISELPQDVPSAQEWQEVMQQSVRQGIAPLLARRLGIFIAHRTIGETVPSEVMLCLERMQSANERRNTVMLRHCARLMEAFQAEGIPCLALKGVALALTIYPNAGLRNFADIDLLVPRAHYRRAGEIAVEMGFEALYAEQEADLLHQTHRLDCEEDILTATLPLEFDATLSREKIEQNRSRIVLEIHCGLFRDVAGFARTVDEAPLWEDARTISLPDGCAASIPSPEVMLVHLATHAASHGFSRLQFSVDIAGVIDHFATTLDWERVIALAERYEVVPNVIRGLELAKRVSGGRTPAAVLHRLTTVLPKHAVPQPVTLDALFASANRDPRNLVVRSLMLSSTPQQFLTGLKNTLFPPPFMMRRLYGVRHPILILLLYVYRPLQLTFRLIGLFVDRIRSRRTVVVKTIKTR